MHFEGKVAQKALVVRSDGKVLVTRDSRDPDTWELPGGRLNLGEKPVEGLERELKEELGVECVAEKVVLIEQAQQAQEGSAALFLIYQVSIKDETKELTVDPIEIAEMDWVDAGTWGQYKYFSEYELALKKHFDQA